MADVRYGLRQLRLRPGFTGLAVATLALGFGANAAVLAMLQAIPVRVVALFRACNTILTDTDRSSRPARIVQFERVVQITKHWATYGE
jgi:hypothetical protein